MFIQINKQMADFPDDKCEEVLKLLLPFIWEDEAVLLYKELKACRISKAVDWVRRNMPDEDPPSKYTPPS